MIDEMTRRRFLRFLLASPIAADLTGLLAACGQDKSEVITAPDQALDVYDFERVARQRLSPTHFGFWATGVDGDATVRANSEGFARLSLRVRRFVDLRSMDTSVSLFGTVWDSPIVLAPVSSQRAFHADGEIASARAARSRKHLQVLSTVASTGVEDVIAARGGQPSPLRCAVARTTRPNTAAADERSRCGCGPRQIDMLRSRLSGRALGPHCFFATAASSGERMTAVIFSRVVTSWLHPPPRSHTLTLMNA